MMTATKNKFKTLDDFDLYQSELTKSHDLSRQHVAVEAQITAAKRRIGQQLGPDVISNRAARFLQGEPLSQLDTDDHKQLQRLEDDLLVLGEALRQQGQLVNEARADKQSTPSARALCLLTELSFARSSPPWRSWPTSSTTSLSSATHCSNKA